MNNKIIFFLKVCALGIAGIILLLFLGWIVWTETTCKGMIGNTICSNSYWYLFK